ncbi:bifunctional hydroxymethylpyrimidine kinase/phosphomethylpyrimidine kinase [Shewanella mesophila]|uniref:bifunctional hydroxymethylpyrimidine kinase/phosphomethylpyrimidine kinase n=1 Tax=Shewanella mesophila TaxID=2864208 RepID=UPI001C65DC31|nr:bifunctional hydroxymethylpyrimidine kinase/phosphomethylpyrimidine kinase [Shewanella mesophila]QYJ87738.1 bifunctional hydroxymethylpyrimidine kinase/phosphomethylpyrimidine kinase [Shewanella mesophila]
MDSQLYEAANAKPRSKPVVWTIAGSDSGGGAGIQADLTTMNDLQCHACTVITAVTAQNSVSVDHIYPLDDSILLAQLNCLLNDLPPDAIKVGLLVNQAQLDCLVRWFRSELATYQQNVAKKIPIILDPVMVATCGDTLASMLDYSALRGVLTLITPNAKELEQLSGEGLKSTDKFSDAAEQLAIDLNTNVLAKGGDRGGFWHDKYAKDLFICRSASHTSLTHQQRPFVLSSPRSDNPNNHGSGCTLSSAIAAFMAHDYVLHDAILLAKAYVSAGIAHAQPIGRGAGSLARMGWPTDLALFPTILSNDDRPILPDDLNFTRLTYGLDIYPVVDSVELLETLLINGAVTVQLRIKIAENFNEQMLEQQIVRAIALGRRYKAQVFINDHWQLALKHKAFGVHLGQEDLFDADLVQIASKGLALGLSSHGYFELKLAAQINPSYIAIGHIFATTTKSMPSQPQGVVKLHRYVNLLSGHFPSVAIGGIDAHNLEDLAVTGVDACAVVRAITQAKSPAVAYQFLSRLWMHSSKGSFNHLQEVASGH